MPNPISASTTKPNKCPDHGVISVSDRGRLGNLMSQYATLYAYSKLLDRQPVISQHMSNTLLKVFPSASIPSSSICKLQGVIVHVCILLLNTNTESLLTAEDFWFFCNLSLKFIPLTNILKTCIDLRQFSKCF